MHVEEISGICFEADGNSEGVNQLTSIFTDAFCAENGTLLISDNFNIAVLSIH